MKPKIITRRMTYDAFMSRVNQILIFTYDLGVDDLPDYCYRDAYNAGDTPEDCANDVIEYAKGF